MMALLLGDRPNLVDESQRLDEVGELVGPGYVVVVFHRPSLDLLKQLGRLIRR